MPDYTLYYWPVPFRGQFVRAVLAHAGATWEEPSSETISDVMGRDPREQPLPFMAPPMLVDNNTGLAVAQMPSILFHLAQAHGLMPTSPGPRTTTTKIVNDANDVLDEITQHGGVEMWTRESWADYLPRLKRWMAIWEETGRRNGLANGAFMLGGTAPGLADLVTATLWFTMADKLPALDPILRTEAPAVHALSHRLMHSGALSRMRADTDARFGDNYCGGQIEQSLRHVLA